MGNERGHPVWIDLLNAETIGATITAKEDETSMIIIYYNINI